MLPAIEQAHARGDLKGEAVAMLVDRVQVHEGSPQTYGTQISLHDGRWVLDPIADSAHVDERRARMGVPPPAEDLALVDSGLYEHQERPPREGGGAMAYASRHGSRLRGRPHRTRQVPRLQSSHRQGRDPFRRA